MGALNELIVCNKPCFGSSSCQKQRSKDCDRAMLSSRIKNATNQYNTTVRNSTAYNNGIDPNAAKWGGLSNIFGSFFGAGASVLTGGTSALFNNGFGSIYSGGGSSSAAGNTSNNSIIYLIIGFFAFMLLMRK